MGNHAGKLSEYAGCPSYSLQDMWQLIICRLRGENKTVKKIRGSKLK